MRKTLLFLTLGAIAASSSAQRELITLDLTKSATPLEFNTENGSWTGTYDDDATSIDSQVFSFVHGSMGEWNTWWGFTASNSYDNARPENTLTHQWSNMAPGGIVLNEEGEVKLDSFGAPVVSPEVPYLVAFYSPWMAARPVDMVFNDGKSYEAVGVYLNLNSYTYYSIEYGDSFARAFTNGDRYTVTIHGIAPDESEKTMEVELAAYSNGDLTINRGWKYVDLSQLGTINELFFTIDSTDTGDYGMNTPAYFCLDKLIVASDGSGVNAIVSDTDNPISYDRATSTVTITGNGFGIIYDATGNAVMTTDGGSIDISALAAGVYVVKSGNHSLKIAR
ncbi:MAG: DUF4465 domain-containing protein [Muribaculaceae bacterium]|nr:DUF4465 domain-containing protein [Muribaculaceae bacterium]